METLNTYTEDIKSDKILWTLTDGRAYTLVELSDYAGLNREETTTLLDRWLAEKLIVIERHRFCYYKFSSEKIAWETRNRLYEKMGQEKKIYPPENPLPDIKYCRSCHGHLAGRVGVQVADKLQEKKFIYSQRMGEIYEFKCSKDGRSFFKEMGIKVEDLENKSGKLAKACLDFSERRHHLGGRLGVAFLDRLIALGWIEKREGTRVKSVTEKGKRGLEEKLGITLQRNDFT